MDQRIKEFVNRLRLWIFGKELLHALLWCIPAGVFLGAVLEIILVPQLFLLVFSRSS